MARPLPAKAIRQKASIGIAFLIGGLFYVAFGYTASFIVALLVLGIAHTGGSILWVFSTVLLQREVEDRFRGRVFAAELALLTLTLAASNYLTGELLDRFGYSPRTWPWSSDLIMVTGIVWFPLSAVDRDGPARKGTYLHKNLLGRCNATFALSLVVFFGFAAGCGGDLPSRGGIFLRRGYASVWLRPNALEELRLARGA